MRAHRSPARTLLVAVAALLPLAGACSAGGDDEASDPTTTEAAPPTSGDEEPRATSTTVVTGTDLGEDELQALLPEAAALGPDYREVEPDDDDDSSLSDETMAEACPEATELAADDDDDDDGEQARAFETGDDRSVEVAVGASTEDLDEGEFDRRISAINDCEPITYEEDGLRVVMRVRAERDDQYGDIGVRFFAEADLDHPMFPEPVDVEFEGLTYRLEGVDVEIQVSSGLEQRGSSGVPVPGDFQLIDELAADIAAGIEAT